MSQMNEHAPMPRRPHPPAATTRYAELDLAREIEQLRREPEWRNGQNARTLVKRDALRIVLTILREGAHVPAHQTVGQISIHALRGHLRVHADGRTFDLQPGTLVALDEDVRHDVEALEESAFLLTIAWPHDPQSRQGHDGREPSQPRGAVLLPPSGGAATNH